MNRLTQERVNQIAAEYIAHNYKKGEALLACGYSKTYANSIGMRLFNNVRVKDALRRMHANLSLKTDITMAFIQSEHLRLAKEAEEAGDLATATRNIEGAGRTIGAYTETIRTGEIKEERQLDEREQAEAARIAQIRLLQGSAA